jgi:hypothetical protein
MNLIPVHPAVIILHTNVIIPHTNVIIPHTIVVMQTRMRWLLMGSLKCMHQQTPLVQHLAPSPSRQQ